MSSAADPVVPTKTTAETARHVHNVGVHRLSSERLRLVRDSAPSHQIASAGGATLSLFGLRLPQTEKDRITDPYRESGWTHICLKVRAKAVAQAPLVFWTGDPQKKGSQPLPPNDPVVRLFAKPVPHMTGAQFQEACDINHGVDGSNFWLFLGQDQFPVRPDGAGLIPIPRHVVPCPGSTVGFDTDLYGWPRSYRVSFAGGRPLNDIPVEAMLRFGDYDPKNPYGGLSDVDVAETVIDMEWKAILYIAATLENGGDPGGFIKVKHAPAKEERAGYESETRQGFKVRKRGQWKVVDEEIEYIPNKLSPKDMEYAAGLKWWRDFQLSLHGVPGPVVNVYEHATYDNYGHAVKQLWSGGNGVLARLRSNADVVNTFFLPRLVDKRYHSVVAAYDVSGIRELQEDYSERIKLAKEVAAGNVGGAFLEMLEFLKVPFDSKIFKAAHEAFMGGGMTTVERVISGENIVQPNDPNADPEDEDDGEETPKSGAKKKPKAKDEKRTDDDDEEATLGTHVERASIGAVGRLETEEARAQGWRTLNERLVLPALAKVARAYKRFRRSYEHAQEEKLRARFAGTAALDERLTAAITLSEVDVASILLDVDEWSKKMDEAMAPVLRSIFATVLGDTAADLGTRPMAPDRPEVVAFLREQSIQLAEGHTSSLAKRVRAALEKALGEATSTGETQREVRDVLPDLEGALRLAFHDKEQRAQTIARTEVAHSVNGARFMQFREDGVTEIQWLSSRDQIVRGTPGGPYEDAEFSHYELDGTTTPIGLEFDHAKHPGLKYPSDPDAQAGDVINCRCQFLASKRG